jgi:sulfate/thiosulfate-binding protein
LRQPGGSAATAQQATAQLFRQVPVLDTGARGSTTTFVQRGQGDVFLSWENEAHLATQEFAQAGLEIIYPSFSILAEPPVTVVDQNVDRRGTRALAEAYLNHLYSEDGQRLAAKHFYRPRDAAILAANAQRFPRIDLVTIHDVFGGWATAQRTHFDDGGVFDRIYRPGR